MRPNRIVTTTFTVSAAACSFAVFMLWGERPTEGFSWMASGLWPHPIVGLFPLLTVDGVPLPNWVPAAIAILLAFWVRLAPRRTAPALVPLFLGLAQIVAVGVRIGELRYEIGSGLVVTLLAYLAMVMAVVSVPVGRVSAEPPPSGQRRPLSAVFTLGAACCAAALPMLWGETPWREVTMPPNTPLGPEFGLSSSLWVLNTSVPNWVPALVAVLLAAWAWGASGPKGMLVPLLYGLAHTTAMAFEFAVWGGYASTGLFLTFAAYFAMLGAANAGNLPRDERSPSVVAADR